MLSGFRRIFRSFHQRMLLLLILIGIGLFTLSNLNLKFCYHIMSQSSYNEMCKKYKTHDYSGSLCEELCGKTLAFKDFKCPQNEMKTTLFTAVKNTDVYAIKRAKHSKEDQTWLDSDGVTRYPKLEDFHRFVKIHITISYNVTLDDNMIKTLVNQEIDANNPQQMASIWRLYNDNNYMMGKLFDEDALFPSILDSCGPYYATENLNIINIERTKLMTIDWEGRLNFALNVLEYLFRLEEVKPEPLRMCEMSANLFGMSTDNRIKYQNAELIYAESIIDKMLSDGTECVSDDECNWHSCLGRCHPLKNICVGKQQNNNLQIFCESILKGTSKFPGLIAKSRDSSKLHKLLLVCINPFRERISQTRTKAPSAQLGMDIFNELKRMHKDATVSVESKTQ